MYSQAGQDEFVLSLIKKGYYLEIGASHPVNISNTYLLEKNGWTGVSIDNDNQCQEIWGQLRTNPLVIADAMTMDYSFLPDRVDYLQVDIEPADNTLKALLALPLNRVRFSVITFEHDRYREGDKVRDKQRELLTSLNYKLAHPDVCYEGKPFEDWWVDDLLRKPS